MTIFDVLALLGGLCSFMFGMNVMGDSLERRAGGGLKLPRPYPCKPVQARANPCKPVQARASTGGEPKREGHAVPFSFASFF